MEVEIKLEPGRQELKVVILAGTKSEELSRLAESLSELTLGPVQVNRGEEKLLLPQGEFLRFYADGKGVSGQTVGEVYAVRLRLYELEEQLTPRDFIRVSKSVLVNFGQVRSLRPDLGGRLRLTLSNGEVVVVNRQYVPAIKAKLGL